MRVGSHSAWPHVPSPPIVVFSAIALVSLLTVSLGFAAAAPDATVLSLAAGEFGTGQVGSPVLVTVAINNLGAATAGSCPVTWYLDDVLQGTVDETNLGPGEMRAVPFSSWTPGTGELGAHTIRARVGPVAGDPHESNDWSAPVSLLVVPVGATYDAEILSLGAGTLGTGEVGSPVLVTAAIRNQGTAPVSSCPVEWYLDGVRQESVNEANLGAGEVRAVQFSSWVPAAGELGAHTIRARVGPVAGDPHESNDWSAPVPLLVVPVGATYDAKILSLGAGALGTGVVGSPVLVTVAIKNQGTAPIGSCPVEWYVDDVWQESGDEANLGAGEVRAVHFSSWVPTAGEVGVHTIRAHVGPIAGDLHENNDWAGPASLAVTPAGALVVEAGPDKAISPGESATLEGSASAGLPPYTYLWSPASGLSDAHVAQPTASPASTTIYTLTVTDALGESASDLVVLTVRAPMADFTADVTRGSAPLLVHFTDRSTNSPTAWAWSFGDGGASAEESPSHTYTKPDQYTVTLAAGNAGGTVAKTRVDFILVSFPDTPVDPEFWALHDILACVDAGIVTGYPDGGYGSAHEVTRDQMAVYISRALAGGDANVPTPQAIASFPDVPTTHWAFRYVEYAKSRNIVTGYPDGSYGPLTPTDRGQMAVYVVRAVVNPTGDAGLAGYTPPAAPSFPDVPADFWAYRHVEYAKSRGVVNGYPDGSYQPAVVVTRDQMAVYVARAFGLM